MIPPILLGFATKHGLKLIAIGVAVVGIISAGSYIYHKGWNARDIIAKNEAAQVALELSELRQAQLEAGSAKVAQVEHARANTQIKYKEVIRYVPHYTDNKPCLSADVVGMLNGETATSAEGLHSDTIGTVATSAAHAATDTDIARWAAEARRDYEQCASALNAIIDLSDEVKNGK